jgi:hypothetical protein
VPAMGLTLDQTATNRPRKIRRCCSQLTAPDTRISRPKVASRTCVCCLVGRGQTAHSGCIALRLQDRRLFFVTAFRTTRNINDRDK